jgi:hypothetical protein
MIKKTINNDLSVIAGTNNSVFTGVDDEVNKWLDPFVSGYAFIYWVELPSWFEKDEDLKYFKQMTQVNFRSFQGVASMDLNTAQVQTGFAAHEMNVVTGISRQNTDFQISHKEYSGSPMTKMYQKWISMIRDPRTNTALYPKLYGVEYGARNHSGQLLYIVTRPDVTNTDKHIVEYACFYSNVVPVNVPLDTLYNFEIGSQDAPTIEISFKGFPEIGPNVNAFAEKILREKIISPDGDSHIPFVDSYNTTPEVTQNVQWGTTAMSEIFAEEEEGE